MQLIHPLSPKQNRSFHESNAKINIWEGAVRSGKTYVSMVRWIYELMTGPDGSYCMIARTYDTFRRNLLTLMTDILGTEAKWYAGKREMDIFGKQVFIVGADDERSESKIRGATFQGAYVDEGTLIPESVFRMLISRCAMKGARIFITTNPDTPYHWLKTDFLDNNPDALSWQFNFEDNPQLTHEEKEYLKRQYKGIWYKRFIEGCWVQAEGAIYDFFDVNVHTMDFCSHPAEQYIVGVDYGTTNPCSFVLIGINKSRFPNCWVEAEYYWDSKIKQRQKTDSEYADDFKKFIANKPIKAIYVDPSAASFKLELSKQGVQNLFDAENEVLDGIRLVSNFMSNGTIKITKACPNLIREIQGYVWDSRSVRLGEDKPLKSHDHCITGDSKVFVNDKYQQIKDIPSHGIILSYDAFDQSFKELHYVDAKKTQTNAEIFEIELEDGSTIKATKNHKFLTINGWKELQHLMLSDTIITCNINSSMIKNSTKTSEQNIGSQQNVLRDECMLSFLDLAHAQPIGIKIKSIRYAGIEDVYCLNVPSTHCFIANGIVVHNCLDAFRYALYSHFWNKHDHKIDWEKTKREAFGLEPELPRFFQDTDDMRYSF